MQSIHGDPTNPWEAMPDTVATFVNRAPVSNQVGGNQIVHGSIYNAPVTILQPTAESFRDASANTVEEPDIYDDDILQLLAFPRMLDRRANIDPPYEQTCGWILDLAEFKSWNAQPRSLLWIKGNPGVGKSVLMAYLYDELRQSRSPDGIYLDFFFNARGDELQKTPVGMLRSLLNQLFRQDPQSRSPLRANYKEKHDAFGHDSAHSWDIKRQELESLLIKSVLLSAQRRQVTIFIDALDEAGEQHAREIARYLHLLNDRIGATSSTCKICISSRHHPVPSTIPGVEIVVESHNRDDIAAFIHTRLSLEYRTLEDTPDLDQWYELKEDLVERANGIFQWVCLVVPILEQYLDYGDSLEDARKFIDKVPESLEKAYEHIVCKIIDPRHRNQSYLLFQWVCLAQRPLSVTDLRYALAAGYARPPPSQIRCSQSAQFIRTDKLMRVRLRTLSGGLIVVMDNRVQDTEPNDAPVGFTSLEATIRTDAIVTGDPCIVQPIHQSVNDFLLAKGLALLVSLRDQSSTSIPASNLQHSLFEEGHAMIYWSCLKYLCSEDPEDSLDTSDAIVKMVEIPSHSYVDSRAHARSDVHESSPFSHYALAWLPTHALAAHDARGQDTELQASLIKLVSDRWLFSNEHQNSWRTDRETRITALHIAAFADLSDLMEHLLKHENDLEAQNMFGYTALQIAAHRGHETVVRQLVRAGAVLQPKTPVDLGQYRSQMTPLALAAANGHASLLTWLLHHLNIMSEQISSELLSEPAYDASRVREMSIGVAFNVAAGHGHLEIVKILITAGAGLDINFGELGTPLQAASRFGHAEIVKSLIEAHADVNILGGRYGSALMAACWRGDIGIVRDLLDSGAAIDIETPGKRAFALQQACARGHTNIVALLISRGADVNLNGGTYGYALHAAAHFNYDNIVQLLLNAGAEVNAVGGKYGTAMLAASGFNNSMNTIKLLLDAGAQINATGNRSYTPLLLASSRAGSANLVRFLLNAGADVNASGNRMGTALQAATVVSCDIFYGQGPTEVVTMLLDAGADINASAGPEGTALEIATRLGDKKMIEFLIDRGAIG